MDSGEIQLFWDFLYLSALAPSSSYKCFVYTEMCSTAAEAGRSTLALPWILLKQNRTSRGNVKIDHFGNVIYYAEICCKNGVVVLGYVGHAVKCRNPLVSTLYLEMLKNEELLVQVVFVSCQLFKRDAKKWWPSCQEVALRCLELHQISVFLLGVSFPVSFGIKTELLNVTDRCALVEWFKEILHSEAQ